MLQKYPETEFARIITDPDYYNKKQAELSLIDKQYEAAYTAYLNDDFTRTMVLCDEATSNNSDHELAPKFQLLRAYSTAKLKDERSFKEELNVLIKQWPGTPESERAAELIAYLNNEIPQLKIEEEKAIASEIYISGADEPHYYVLIIEDPKFNLNQATFDVINFNIDNYTNSNYRTQGTLVDEKFIMITVGTFTNGQNALEYYSKFTPATVVRNAGPDKIRSFVMTETNLQMFNKDKDPGRYQIFFDEVYLLKDNTDAPASN